MYKYKDIKEEELLKLIGIQFKQLLLNGNVKIGYGTISSLASYFNCPIALIIKGLEPTINNIKDNLGKVEKGIKQYKKKYKIK